MRRAYLAGVFLLVALNCPALQVQFPLGGSGPSEKKPARVTSRTLTGIVIDKGDKPIPNAVVYLKNTKSLAVKTYIAGDNGVYRFPELSLNVDYEVYAERNGKRSGTKVLSQFDDREKPNINLKIDVNK